MALVDTLARSAIQSVTVRSTLTPDVVIDPFSQDPGDRQASVTDPSGLVLSFLRPAVYIQTPAGVVPIEPYGSPDSTLAPVALAIGAALVAGVLYLAWQGFRKRKR